MKKISRLSRRIFLYVIGDRKMRRAIAFAIYMKVVNPASVVKDWTPEMLARITHLDSRTCKKYVNLLREMRLLSEHSKKGHSYLVFKPLKEGKKKNKRKPGYHTSKHHNVMLGDYDNTSVKAIEIHLQALFICEIQRRKDYYLQNVNATQNPKNLREYKKAQKICHVRGWNSFSDDGISYKYICNALNCSPNSVSKIIRYGESAGLFTVTRYDPKILFFGVDQAREAAEYWNEKWSWCTDDIIVYQRANKFTLNQTEKPKDSGMPRVRSVRKR